MHQGQVYTSAEGDKILVKDIQSVFFPFGDPEKQPRAIILVEWKDKDV